MKQTLVTIDGPSGTGKSTISSRVAGRLGLPHLDTGAFYRAATLAAIQSGVDLSSEEAVAKVVAVVELEQVDGRMFLDGVDVSEAIRAKEINLHVSEVSAHPRVREILVAVQRSWVRTHGGAAVVEGRDIGSVVFPDAPHKIYLDARPEVRAERRASQEKDDIVDVFTDIERRDRHDSTRRASPLAVPAGAVSIDTSDMSVDEVVSRVISVVNEA